MFIDLQRPLIFFDIESTGTNISTDRMVEICLIKLHPDGSEERLTERFNPEMPIPANISQIINITDEDLKDCPKFGERAHELARFLEDCDFAGFNSNRFDFPMLVEEFMRAGVDFDTDSRKFIDVMRIFHVMEPRNLGAAYKFYCDKNLENAHSAEADTSATLEVFRAQLARYEQLENNVDSLHKVSGQSNFVDLAGRMVYDAAGKEVFNFGKHKGKVVTDVLKREPAYYDWMMNGEFPLQTKKMLTRIRLRDFNKGQSASSR
jgi:DNA polymerase III subunit epsilon